MQLGGKSAVAAPGEVLQNFYNALLESFGPQGWWPAKTRWEIICGAILTQNTTWRNATLALKNLRKAGLLAWGRWKQVSLRELEILVKPAGFYRQKARTLHGIAAWIEQAHGGSLDSLFAAGVRARLHLLALKGIGAETADAILLYAGRQALFVADAYTRRVLSRHQLLPRTADYESAQQYLHQHLTRDATLYSELHALLVEAAKRYCRREVMHCESCPLGKFLERPTTNSPETIASADGQALALRSQEKTLALAYD